MIRVRIEVFFTLLLKKSEHAVLIIQFCNQTLIITIQGISDIIMAIDSWYSIVKNSISACFK